MIEMSPFYAYESSVGPVFDVATWSRFKTTAMAVVALGFGILALAVIVFAWCPDLAFEEIPEFVSSFHQETMRLKADKPWAAYAGSVVVGLIAYLAIAGACACAVDVFHDGYYLRVGAGGISLQLPCGLDFGKLGFAFKRLQLDIPLANLSDWTIVQRKQLGSMSRSTGNISASLRIRTIDGTRREFSLDCFREPAFVIQSKINDALQMVPAQFGPEDTTSQLATEAPLEVAGGIEEKYDAIQNTLARLVEERDPSPAVVISDAQTGKFVQLLASGGTLLVDLPANALDVDQAARAKDYFQSVETGLGDIAAGAVGLQAGLTAPDSFQAHVRDAGQAARIVLDVFDRVYQRPGDFPMEVELV